MGCILTTSELCITPPSNLHSNQVIRDETYRLIKFVLVASLIIWNGILMFLGPRGLGLDNRRPISFHEDMLKSVMISW